MLCGGTIKSPKVPCELEVNALIILNSKYPKKWAVRGSNPRLEYITDTPFRGVFCI